MGHPRVRDVFAAGIFAIGLLSAISQLNDLSFTNAGASADQTYGHGAYGAGPYGTGQFIPSLTFTSSPAIAPCSLQAGLPGTFRAAASPAALDLGKIDATGVASSANNFTIESNAEGGAGLTVRGLHPNNNLRNSVAQPFLDQATAPIAGSARFAYTVSDADAGADSWKALDTTDAVAATSASGSFSDECVGFSVSASPAVPAGAYSATVIFTATATF